jgi:hypothetical protein
MQGWHNASSEEIAIRATEAKSLNAPL